MSTIDGHPSGEKVLPDSSEILAAKLSSDELLFASNDISGIREYDHVLYQKISLINDAIDEIGFTPYHLKLFFLNGMGYAVDTQLTYIELAVRTFVNYQFGYRFPVSNVCYAGGMILGAVVWGLLADLVGRKLAFNMSLILASIFCILTGLMGNMATYCLFTLLTSFAAGGNLVLDACVFLEFLPTKNQWLLTFFAFFWGIGQTVSVLIAYAFLPNNSCLLYELCLSSANKGWRYVYYVNGSIVLALAVLRVTVVRLKETPKFYVSNDRDAEAVAVLQGIATKYNRNCSLTLEKLAACGTISSNRDVRQITLMRELAQTVGGHIRILFSNKLVARLTILLVFSWLCLGITYPLYSAFLPVYLATRGANISAPDIAGVYRDNLISNASSIGGPLIAGGLLYYIPRLGRRGVLFLGGISTLAFLFGYTQIKTRSQNVALSLCVYVTLYVYYAVIFAYSPEVMPSTARATGNSLCIMSTRIASVMAPIIAWYADTLSQVPIWICGAFVGAIGVVALFLPFEPSRDKVM